MMAAQAPAPEPSPQKGSKPSMLKSFIHKRNPSAGTALSMADSGTVYTTPAESVGIPALSFLPKDHPHSRALSELQHNNQNHQPTLFKNPDGANPHNAVEEKMTLQKKTMSTISLKRLAAKDTDKDFKPKETRPRSPKKSKSSTNLANLLSRPKTSKSLRQKSAAEGEPVIKDKENDKPTPSYKDPYHGNPPIYAQFSTEQFPRQPQASKFIEHEIDLYTPQNYTPGKQRNFCAAAGLQPTLHRHGQSSQRPMSIHIPGSFSVQDLSRRVVSGSRHSGELARRVSDPKRPNVDRKPTAERFGFTMARGQRMLTALNPLSTQPKQQFADPQFTLKDEDTEKEFEAMLDRRNIPENQRWKMRSLALSMKKDFVRQDWSETTAAKDRPTTKGSDSSAEPIEVAQDGLRVKKKRPRSRTFTLSRSSSKDPPASRRAGQESNVESSRKKSGESSRGGKSLTATGAAAAQNIIAKAKGQLPDDFVSYLRKVQKPELVEVGRIHKLRLLLRNETVAWTDEFIKQGGMEEIVALLHKILAVEWREEHEDTLLHEDLLCLKALSTTALALQNLDHIHHTLFPALLHMLFDEEKKGPSEFSTRTIMTSLLMTYLKSAPVTDREAKANIILSYLRNPEPKESDRPVDFVLDMRRPRPYTTWCKEVVNVTKEVFWIFLHNLNVVPLPGTKDSEAMEQENKTTNSVTLPCPTGYGFSIAQHVYMARHFPKELPPVPAAPYVGGVEWDATNYLASHLDLMNGIIACIPTKDERNGLRSELQISGWEKCMGGSLRLCKEKFYGGVHAGLRCWVAAAIEDGWDTRDVRCGPVTESTSPVKGNRSPKKSAAIAEPPPRIDTKLDFGSENSGERDNGIRRKPVDSGWL